MKKIELNFNFNYIAIFLTAVFALLKATNIVSWSWLWVLSPLWILTIVMLACLIGIYTMRKFFHWTFIKR